MNLRSPFSSRTTIPVVRLEGVISSAGRSGSTLSDTSTEAMIEKAFKGKPVAVALQINSPGGSAAQSALIAARIRRLAEEKGVHVYAFCEDVAASGGYWLATAADEIYADANSILGSIGVISASFGMHELIARWGIERRVHTAGEDKSMLDPFRPERAEDVTRLKDIQRVIHDNFINQVKTRRAAQLKRDDIFTGEVFTAAKAVEIGLADGIGHMVPVLKHKFGDKVAFKVLKQKRSVLSRFGIGAAADQVLSVADDRAHWARYGL